MKHIIRMFLCSIVTITHIMQPSPNPQIPGLLSPQYAISIKPTDFSAGPVVITSPGYYILTNDVLFNPASPNSVDSFGNAWKAALIVLADCVTVDLNTHSMQQSSSYSSSNFKLIQIGGTNVLDPEDITEYNPKQVTIKNGCLNQSEGYGIYGKNNDNLSLYDITISSCDIAGIFLQNLHCSSIKKARISGSSNGAGNVYGIFLRDNNTTAPEWTSDSSGSDGPKGIVLEDIKICDITTDSSLNIDNEIIDLLCQALNKLDISDITNITNCVSVTLQACIASLSSAVNTLISFINVAKVVPSQSNVDAVVAHKDAVLTAITNCLAIIDALPNPSEEELQLKAALEAFQACMDMVCNLLDQAEALLTGQNDYINGTVTPGAWHAYGIRITNGNGIEINNCFITGTTVNSAVTTATRAIGLALDKCVGCIATNCFLNKSSVNLGAAIGCSIATSSEGNYLEKCISTAHTSNDEVYGYWLCQSDCQTFLKCETSANHAVTKAKGFYFEQCDANQVKECKSFCMSCALAAANDPAQVIGFESLGSNCNTFDFCETYNLTADTAFQNSSYVTNVLSAGFRLRSYPDTTDPVEYYDTDSVITNSISRCLEGSAGNSAGILLDGARCSTIKKNTVATSRSLLSLGGTVGGNGYGIYDTASDTTALIIENKAYANQTLNYKVSYSLENEQLPVVQSTYGDMTSIFIASTWHNISLYANPGSTGCNAACSPNAETSIP